MVNDTHAHTCNQNGNIFSLRSDELCLLSLFSFCVVGEWRSSTFVRRVTGWDRMREAPHSLMSRLDKNYALLPMAREGGPSGVRDPVWLVGLPLCPKMLPGSMKHRSR